MKAKEIIKEIEELDEMQLNDIILAVCRTYNRINQENELALVALPKHDPEKRKQVIAWFNKISKNDVSIL